MKIANMQGITVQEIVKIFPSEYHKKYDPHFIVHKFEKQSIQQEQKIVPMLKIYKREEKKQEMPSIPIRKEYNKHYESFSSMIEKNKEEHIRMGIFNKVLSLKLQTTPEKKQNKIWSPIKQALVDENVLEKLKMIEDLEHERMIKQRNSRQKILQQKSICKFIRKIKSTTVSPRKFYKQPIEQTNPEQTKSMNKNQLLFKSEPNLPKLKILGNLSKPKKQKSPKRTNILYRDFAKNNSASKTRRKSLYPKQNQKRDWFKQKQRMREHVQSMEVFKYHDILLFKKKHEKFLKEP